MVKWVSVGCVVVVKSSALPHSRISPRAGVRLGGMDGSGGVSFSVYFHASKLDPGILLMSTTTIPPRAIGLVGRARRHVNIMVFFYSIPISV